MPLVPPIKNELTLNSQYLNTLSIVATKSISRQGKPMPTITFLHTSPVHIKTFNALVDKLAPDIPVRHIVDESLLQEAVEGARTICWRILL